MTGFAHRHLLGMESLSPAEIAMLLDLGDSFLEINERPIKKVPTLRGKTVINLFLEPSTRTRTSFEIAAKRLSADAINISGSASSTVKGETLLDTARNLDAMAPDVVVLRHAQAGAAEMLAVAHRAARGQRRRRRARASHAGAARLLDHPRAQGAARGARRRHLRRHPPQPRRALEHLRLHQDGRARPDRRAAHAAGARAGGHGDPGQRVIHERLEPALEGADVIMMLRIQKERIGGALFPNTREYSRYFGLNPRRLALAKPDAIVMHPGPINRGVEIDPAVADGPRAVILDQVARGVAIRMAVLYLLAGGDAGPSE